MSATTTGRKPDINLWEVAYRKRFGLGPFYVGAGAAALAGISAALSQWQAIVLFCVVGAALLAWVHTRVSSGGRAEAMRRAYLFTVVGITVGWMIFARFYFPELASWIVLFNISGCLLFGMGWWSSRRQRSRVQMEASIEDFPAKMKKIGFEKIRTGKAYISGSGYHGRLHWDAGDYDVDEVLKAKSKFNNVMAKLRGQLRFEPDGKSTNSIKYRVIEKDPHAQAQPFPIPTQVRRASDMTVIGPREDGETVGVRRYDPAKGSRNVLAGGTIGSGKSSFTNVCVAEDVLSDDVFPIALDMKQVEFTPWRPVLGYCITSLPPAQQFIRALMEPTGLFETRGNILAARGARVWNTEIDGPIIDIIMDETKEILGNGDIKTVNAFATLATKGRAYGIRFVLASQFPTLESIGSSQVRQQVGIRLCFRMEDSAGEDFVMPGNRVFAEQIDEDRPGTCYVKDGSRLNSMPVRVLYIDDALRDEIVALRTGKTTELDPASAAAIERFFPDFADRPRPGLVPAQRDSDENGPGTDAGTPGTDSPGTGGGTAGTETGTPGTDDDGQEEFVDDEPKWIDVQTGPEVDTDEVLAIHREGQTPEQRQAAERDRRAAQIEIETAESRKMPEPQAREAVLQALAEVWPEGVQAKELIALTGRSSSWFYTWASALDDAGVMKRSSERPGHWVLKAPPPALVKA